MHWDVSLAPWLAPAESTHVTALARRALGRAVRSLPMRFRLDETDWQARHRGIQLFLAGGLLLTAALSVVGGLPALGVVSSCSAPASSARSARSPSVGAPVSWPPPWA